MSKVRRLAIEQVFDQAQVPVEGVMDNPNLPGVHSSEMMPTHKSIVTPLGVGMNPSPQYSGKGRCL